MHYSVAASGEELRQIIRRLPAPCSRWRAGDGSTFEIYRAKDFSETWMHAPLHQLVFLARAASNVPYGRPLVDGFDAKSAVYLGRARYVDTTTPHGALLLEEWLCVRLVYGNGMPAGTGELDFYLCGDNKTVEQKMRESFFCNYDAKDFQLFFAASNRMCSIRPFVIDSRGMTSRGAAFHKNRHTAILYALINKHFLDDCLLGGPCQMISGIILNRIVDNALALCIGEKSYGAHFTPAHALLGVPPNTVRLDRAKDDLYIYRYPTYFLDVPKLITTLSDLCARQVLSEFLCGMFLGGNLGDMRVRERYALNRLRSLGALLSIQGRIPHSALSGEELRRILYERVPDGPELKLTPLPLLEQSVEDMISACCLNRMF